MPKVDPRWILGKSKQIVSLIERADQLAMASDGNVPETQDVLTRDEKRRVLRLAYRIAKAITIGERHDSYR